MPERVWLKQDGTWALVSGTAALTHITFYVPESALLAAEARVREVEAERDALARQLERRADGMDPLTQSLRAERDALVPLAWWGLQEALGFVPEITPPTDEQITQARAILARETGE